MKHSREIKHDLGGICRACLNEKYGLSLTPKDCEYDEYPRECGRCSQVRNIVCGLRGFKGLLLRFK